ncbi:MAG: sigma-70 family RNA polymerase sigma factor [Verrucomicrobiae bacterium]|nr:sigma-70 family RNA polymerase sigma factor [Verrucomicrobiae bacterium]
MSESSPETLESGKAFPQTPWTVLLNVRDENTLGSDALAELCRIYWYPVYAYIRRRGKNPEDAEDLAQGFFEGFLRRGDFATVDRAKGRLRSFLATAISHYLSQEYRRQSAARRGGGRPLVPIDADEAESRYAEEPSDELSPEKLFERKWAVTSLETVLDDLKAEYVARGKQSVFDALSGFLAGSSAVESYAAAGELCDMSESAVKMTVHRMRKRFRDLLHRRIAATVETADEVESEIRWMMATFAE